MKSENQLVFIDETRKIELWIKREDLIHPFVSGNKFRKLKYNLTKAKTENKTTILTFGGAFSNHIAAVAFAGQENGFATIGVIRGDELASKTEKNPTLKFAEEHGMKLEFIPREAYRNKNEIAFLNMLEEKHGNFYLIPEGGTNDLAIKGCEEILSVEDKKFNYICTCIGTGGTISGMINSILPHQKVLGFPALKGNFLQDEIRKFAKNNNWELILDYHFGGYAKVDEDLIAFINSFYQKYKIPLDPIYTSKMVFGVTDLINKNYFPENSKILMVHTGGLQAIAGMNLKLKNKNLKTIEINV